MKPRKIALRLSALALVTTVPYAVSLVGCGNSNPTPGNPDASHPPDAHGSDSKADTAKQSDGKTSDTNQPDSIVDSGTDTNLPDVNLDTGKCTPDSSACNSCYTDAQAAADPFNACSAYTKNCVPFTTTVPKVPPL
jgi:hypothetical protein